MTLMEWIGITLGLLMIMQVLTIGWWAWESRSKRRAVRELLDALARRHAPLLDWSTIHICDCGHAALADHVHLIDLDGIRHTPWLCQPVQEYID